MHNSYSAGDWGWCGGTSARTVERRSGNNIGSLSLGGVRVDVDVDYGNCLSDHVL